jgi:hypothetical protein
MPPFWVGAEVAVDARRAINGKAAAWEKPAANAAAFTATATGRLIPVVPLAESIIPRAATGFTS